MTLDRALAFGVLLVCVLYGYAAWFTMDGDLPPFLQRNPVWPSTFPKILSVMGAAAALWVIAAPGPTPEPGADDVDYRRLPQYHWGQASILIALMLAYAAALRPLGFVPSTILFVVIGAWVLGERRWWISAPVAAVATLAIWYLVSEVLSIFLRPFPVF